MDEMTRDKIAKHQQRYLSFLKAMNCCPLCSSPLTLIHEINAEEETIKETAHCEKCDVETRRKNHSRH